MAKWNTKLLQSGERRRKQGEGDAARQKICILILINKTKWRIHRFMYEAEDEAEASPISELDKNGDTMGWGRGEGSTGGDYGTNLRGKAKKGEENLAKRASCRLNFKMNNFASEWMNEPASERVNE